MGHPVTTNPLIIMLINMTVVFIVLVCLMYMIKLIHFLDPTKPKEEPEPAPVAQTAPPAPVEQPAPVVEEGIPGEVVAAIAAAVAACGASGDIRSIRPVNREGWKQSGRVHIMHLG